MKNYGNERRSLLVGGLLSHVLVTNAKVASVQYLKRQWKTMWWTMENTHCLEFGGEMEIKMNLRTIGKQMQGSSQHRPTIRQKHRFGAFAR